MSAAQPWAMLGKLVPFLLLLFSVKDVRACHYLTSIG